MNFKVIRIAITCLVLVEAQQALLGAAQAADQREISILYVSAVEGDKTALQKLRVLAGAGILEAQTNLGMMYTDGRGVLKDMGQAAYWYRKAAEQGDSLSQLSLGIMYNEGEGVPKDLVQAVYWYRKAAEKGDMAAQSMIGEMYAVGDGLPKNLVQAVYWYRKAAEQGYARAQSNLGAMYAIGAVVPRDLVISYMWRNLAAAQGNEIARKAREALEQDMTREQIAEAQKLSREWKPKK